MRISLLITSIVFLLSTASFSPKAFAQEVCVQLPADAGKSVLSVTIINSGTYRVWSRMKAADSQNNSYYLKIDDNCPVLVGDSPQISNANWSWVDYQNGDVNNKIDVNLTAGDHTINLIENEPGVGVDKVLLTKDLSCVPSGYGENCPSDLPTPTLTQAPTAVPSATPTPILTPTLSPTPIPTTTPTPTPTPTPSPTPTIIPTSTPMQEPTNSNQSSNTNQNNNNSNTVPVSHVLSANFIKNPSFETRGRGWISPWSLLVRNGARGQTSQSSQHADGKYSAKISITRPTLSDYNVRFSQSNISVINNATYEISFWAKTSDTGSVRITVQNLSSSSFYFQQNLLITPSWQKYTFNFTAPTTNANSILTFNLSGVRRDVFLDSISLVRVQ